MAIEMSTPTAHDLPGVLTALAGWQQDGRSVQLHPGDIGWNERFGAEFSLGTLRTWARGGELVAVGLIDSPELVRLGMDPGLLEDPAVAEQIADDLSDPARGALPQGRVCVEARLGGALADLLVSRGWQPDAPWSPLSRDLSGPVEEHGLEIVAVGEDRARDWVTVEAGAFENSTSTFERWQALAAGPAYANARTLVGYADGTPVASTIVWSAGRGRPGLLEPLGVHRDHRGHGYGRAISLAAAAALQEMGSSSATVATPSSNVGAMATYGAAGYRALPEVRDLRRDG